MPFVVGSRVGPYELLKQIGRGGMGVVFRARDTRLDREVALKCISEDVFAGASSAGTGGSPKAGSYERFLREARAVSALNHPNICTIHDIGEQDGQPYLVMELLHGQTLRQLLTHGKLSADDTLRFLLEASSALMAAHAQNIIHRDIKPANLFIVETGHGPRHLKILDFGLAKKHEEMSLGESSSEETATQAMMDPLTGQGSAVGTVAYMSPEQARGEVLDPRTDIFSLGCVAYQMATGVAPFTGPSPADIFVALLTKEPPPPRTLNSALPAGFDTLVARMLAKDRDVRYPSAAAVHEDVERLMQTGKLREPDRGHFATRRAAAYFAMGLGLFVLIGLGILLWPRHRQTGVVPPTPPAAPAAPSADAAPQSPSQVSSIVLTDFDNRTKDPVFDTTLREALAVQLEQSPLLHIVGAEHMQQSLQYIGKPANTPITLDVARDIAEREGIRAVITGSISLLGSQYDISVEAINSNTGDVIGREQATAPRKEDVLGAIGTIATKLRSRLGESLESIQKLNTPLGQATTSSLEAFRAYALGEQAHQLGHETEALGYYGEAIRLDPKFAMAYARTGAIYETMSAGEKAITNIATAYRLSDTVSPREKLYIRARYFSDALGDVSQTIAAWNLYSQLYPADAVATNNLSIAYMITGQFAKAQEYAQKTIASDSKRASSYANLMNALLAQDQAAQAEQVYQQNQAKLGAQPSLDTAHMVAEFMLGNQQAVSAQVQASANSPEAYMVVSTAAWLAEAQGKMQQAAIMWQQSVDLAEGQKLQDAAGPMLAYSASDRALVGDCTNVRDETRKALALDKERVTTYSAALALALCGDKEADPLLKRLARTWPQDTLVQHVFIPSVTAAQALQKNNPQAALLALNGQEAYDLVSLAPYLRGQAYLALHQPLQALEQFSIVRGHRGAFIAGGIVSQYASTTLAYPLSELGVARTYAAIGNKPSARSAFQSFLTDWKDADANLQPVIAARQELTAVL